MLSNDSKGGDSSLLKKSKSILTPQWVINVPYEHRPKGKQYTHPVLRAKEQDIELGIGGSSHLVQMVQCGFIDWQKQISSICTKMRNGVKIALCKL